MGSASRKPQRGTHDGFNQGSGDGDGEGITGSGSQNQGGRGEPSSGEAVMEPVPCAGEPTGRRPGRPSEESADLLAGFPFEAAEHKNDPVPFREPGDLLIQHLIEFSHHRLGRRRGQVIDLQLVAAGTFRTFDTNAEGGPERDTVQPCAHHLAACNLRSLARQDEECGLEGIVRISRVTQEPAAGRENGWSVATDEQFECGFVVVSYPARGQIRVRHPSRGERGVKSRKLLKPSPVGHTRPSLPHRIRVEEGREFSIVPHALSNGELASEYGDGGLHILTIRFAKSLATP